VIEIADRFGQPLIVLEGDPTYYSRLGFVPAATLRTRHLFTSLRWLLVTTPYPTCP